MRLLTNLTGAVLLAAAMALLLINWTNPADLVLPHDPIFGLSTRNLFWIAGGLALLAAVFVLFNDRASWPLLLLAWLAANLLVYQGGVYWQDGHGLTGYLGGFSRTFGISASTANALGLVLTGYLLAASGGALFWQWRCQKLEERFLKMPCPACGGHIKFGKGSVGEKIVCPHCRAAVTLRKPENLKMSCYFCKEHIEFPTHALGRKIACPHCRKDITLQLPGATA